jgi:predicted nucleotidyltransferase
LAVRRSVQRVIDVYRPEKIILFGSYAQGRATRDSDVDLLLIKRRPRERRLVDRVGRILDIVPFGTPVEPVVLTPGEVTARLRAGDYFIQDVLRTGTVLYEKPA